MSALPRAHGEPVLRACIRSRVEDFRVEEIDAFEASGAGEHLLVTVEKRGLTTPEAARRLAQWAGIAESAVGHAGLKDRHAITRQRFTLWRPGQGVPDAPLETPHLRVLGMALHSRKLPRGALEGNRFTLVLRNVQGARAAIEQRLAAIATRGVPNAFGEQRFGRGGDNVEQALAMFAGKRVKRESRSLLLSAARSELFNRVLGRRIRDGDWSRAVPGDVFMLEGSHSVFGPVPLDAALQARIAAFDIHPTGPLWGRGELRTLDEARALEASALSDERCLHLRDGLERAGMKQERRALRLSVRELAWKWAGDDVLELCFELPPGSYATVVLAELGEIVDAQRTPA